MFKKILNSTKALYSKEFPKTITYMLQQTDYEVWPYLKWFWSAKDFSKIRAGKQIKKSRLAQYLLASLQWGIFFELILGVVLIFLSIFNKLGGGWAFGVACLIGFPVIWSQLICVPVVFARLLMIQAKKKPTLN